MKSPTEHLSALRKSIKQARTIVSRVPAERSETDLHHLKVQAFIMLTHAALEEYLENLGRSVAIEARRSFSKDGQITHSLVSLVASKLIDDLPEKSKKNLSKDLISNLDSFSKEAVNRYEDVLKDNHGIRHHNQSKILIPIGVDPEKTDVITANTLDSYGAWRGSLAHTFSLIRTEHTLGDTNKNLSVILDGLETFDRAACKALSFGMTAQQE